MSEKNERIEAAVIAVLPFLMVAFPFVVAWIAREVP